jgi:phage terminase large subunit-like protein
MRRWKNVLVKSSQSVSDADILREYASRWTFQAHTGQIPPSDKAWFCYLMRSGRGGGKTRAGAEWVLQRVRDGYKSIALIGANAADVRDIMIELGESSICKVARPEEVPTYEPSKRRLTFPNGAVAVAFSDETPDQLRGPQHDSAWIDELAKFKNAQETWDNLLMGLRLGKNPQVFITTTPRPTPLLKELLKSPDTIDVRFSTFDNADNLSPKFLAKVKEKYEGTRLGRQELEGEILDDNPEALWQRAIIENLRIRPEACPQLMRVVIGVDPAVTSGKTSDDTGIIAAGIGINGHGYILGDNTIHGTPHDWALETVKAFRRFQADRVIGEVNNGGDLVEVNIRTVNPNIPFYAVHASRGKAIRAEPVSGMYEQGRIHHVGTFPELEDQLCEWTPGDKSPDRMDALVWAIWELFNIGEDQPMREIIYQDTSGYSISPI